jgi:hypothetical protein
VSRDRPTRTYPYGQKPRFTCMKCHEQPYLLVNTIGPDYDAFMECRCGSTCINDLVTVRWAIFSRSDPLDEERNDHEA